MSAALGRTEMKITIKQYEQAADEKVSIGGIKWLKKWDVCVQCDSLAEAETLRARLAEKEQEPVAWISKHGVVYPSDAKYEVNPVNELQPLYTAPPKREWVGLTDEEIRNEANHHVFDESFFNGAVWARGKIKEKNNG